MKVYKKVKDVLSVVESFHRELADRYQEGSVAAQKEDVAMLLAHLSRRERRLQQGLDKFMRAGQEGINETRIQYLSKEGELVLDDMELSSMMSVDEVVSVAKAMDDRLLVFYEEMMQKTALPPDVREMFKRLLQQTKQVKVDLVETGDRVKRT